MIFKYTILFPKNQGSRYWHSDKNGQKVDNSIRHPFWAGVAAPSRSRGQMELRHGETNVSAIEPEKLGGGLAPIWFSPLAESKQSKIRLQNVMVED